MTTDWTPDRIETLVTLWNAGHTSGQIAKVMGVTRNAVIGKAHRLDLPRRDSPIKTRSIVKRQEIPVPRKDLKEKLKNGSRTLLEIGLNECRFMTPDDLFCGRPTKPGKPFCEGHAKITYTHAKIKSP